MQARWRDASRQVFIESYGRWSSPTAQLARQPPVRAALIRLLTTARIELGSADLFALLRDRRQEFLLRRCEFFDAFLHERRVQDA